MTTAATAQPLPRIEIAHVLPCKIDYAGAAPVREFFDSTRYRSASEETAAFRGRPLNGKEIPLLENGYRLYKAAVVKSRNNGEGRNGPPDFRSTTQIDRLIYWNLDKPPSETGDGLPKLMRYLKGAAAFAAVGSERNGGEGERRKFESQ